MRSCQNAPEARPWEYSAFPVTVSNKQQLTPGFIRITFTGSELRHFAPWGLDQRIKLVLPTADGYQLDFGLLDKPTPHPRHWYTRWRALPAQVRNPLRTYTLAAIRPASSEIDVDLYIHHPAGPASTWALDCQLGDEIIITGPDVRVGFTGYGIHYSPPHPLNRVLLIGDESALPAITNILLSLAEGPICACAPPVPTVEATVYLELADQDDDTLTPTVAARGIGASSRIHLVERGQTAGTNLQKALRDSPGCRSPALAAADSYVWVAGEAGATTAIRRHLATCGIPKSQIAFLGYWKFGGPLVA